jgi:hypothetical protein
MINIAKQASIIELASALFAVLVFICPATATGIIFSSYATLNVSRIPLVCPPVA